MAFPIATALTVCSQAHTTPLFPTQHVYTNLLRKPWDISPSRGLP